MTLTKKEQQLIRRLNTPEKIQQFIDSLKYNTGKRISIVDVIRKRKADCLEAACFATLCLKNSFIMDLSCKGNDEDHVICIYKKDKLYGSVAQSKYINLKQRNPVYRSLRELAMSYFDNFFNYNGEFDLVSRSIPLKIKSEWVCQAEKTQMIENKLNEIKHIKLVPKLKLPKVTKLKFHAELPKLSKKAKINKRYI